MASLLSGLGPLKRSTNMMRTISLNSVSKCNKDPQIIQNKIALLKPEEAEHRKLMQKDISVEEPMDLTHISGVPKEHIHGRLVRVYQREKNVMQSGTDGIGSWVIEFDRRKTWENPLMGWTSSGDPLASTKVTFITKEQAIEFCQKNGWKFFVQSSSKKLIRSVNYGDIYSWNKRTRATTK